MLLGHGRVPLIEIEMGGLFREVEIAGIGAERQSD